MIYNIPITWTQKPNTANNPEWNGVIDLNTSGMSGNNIQANWGTLNCNSILSGKEGSSWYYLQVDASLTQGETITNKIWEASSTPYGFDVGTSFTQTFKFNQAMIMANTYSLEISQVLGKFNPFNPSQLLPLDVTNVFAETPKNFTKLGTTIYQPLTISWHLDSTNLCDYEVLQAGKQIMSATNVNVRSVTIPSGTLKDTENVVINVRSHFVFLGQRYTSQWATYTVSGLKEFKGTEIANFRYLGNTKNIEEPLKFAWDNVDPLEGVTNKAIVEVWQNGYLIHSKSGIASCSYDVPSYILTSIDPIQVKVRNVSTYLSYEATSSDKVLSISDLTSIKPVVTDFVLTTNNRDYDINVTHTSTGATEYAIEYANKRYKGLVIAKDTLVKGSCEITFVAIVTTSQGNKVETKLTKTFDIVQDEPTIYSLEPHELNMNVTQPILISFITSEFVDRWELTLPNGLIIGGTTAREHMCPKNTFVSGANSITLKTYYKGTRTDTRISTFTGYGVPKNPIISVNSVYSTATPTFTWSNAGFTDSDIQTGYSIKVIDVNTGLVANQLDENTITQTYTCTTALTNNTTYRLELKIKNKYNIWSDVVKSEFITQFTQLTIPILKLYNNGDNVLISIETEGQPTNFSECKIYKREGRENWIEIGDKYNSTDTLLDYAITPNKEIYYKCRLFDTNGAFSESDEVSTIITINNFNLFSVEDAVNENIKLDFVNPTYNMVNDVVYHTFAGNRKPVPFGGRIKYTTTQLTITCEDYETDKLNDLVRYGKVFCYRTWKGQKMYVSATIDNITPLNRAFNSVVMTLTEVNFNEYLMYQGTGRKILTYMNGVFFMDGTIDMSGETLIYNKRSEDVGII